jgi:hypothetical protein
MDETTEAPKKPRKPITGERAFEDTAPKADKYRKIVEFVNEKKNEYFKAPEYAAYMERVRLSKLLINQDPAGLETRFKVRHSLMRAGYDNLVDSLDDLFDVDDLVICRADSKETEDFAGDWQLYLNRLLRSIKYQEHLSERFLYLPDYGWSIAHDSYRFSDGWVVKPQVDSRIPGLDAFDFGMEEDVYMDRPEAEVVRPDQWFGSIEHSGRHQPYQGTLKRWYLKDVLSAMERKDKAGKPLYNLPELQKLADKMALGHQDADQHMKTGEDEGSATRDVEYGKQKHKGPFVDIIRFHGALNEITDKELAADPNEYYIECTRSCLLRWQENPRDRLSMYTHARTHAYRNNPFSRSYLDTTRSHQIWDDFLMGMSAEAIIDNLTKHWGVWEDDMLDPNDFYSPRGLNAFIVRQGQGRLPEFVGGDRSGAFSDIKDVLTIFDRDRQRSGPTDQEMGVQGGTADKTATTARILAAATSKSKRSIVKRISRQAVLPQIKNIGMLSLVHSRPENLKFMAGDKAVRLTGEHLKFWMRAYTTDTQILLNDTITRDRNEEAMKATTFFTFLQQMGAQMPPDTLAHVGRYAGELSGIPQSIIDKALPEPLPVNLTLPDGREVTLPSAMAMPPPPMPGGMPMNPAAAGAAPLPMQGENPNASMAPPPVQ